jgi:hypothetical protein
MPPPTSAPLVDTTTVVTETIKLAGAWRGQVVVRIDDPSTALAVPTGSQWVSILESFLQDPFAIPDGVTLKYSLGAEVLRGTLHGAPEPLDVVAKHHSACGWSGRLSSIVSGSRGKRNFDRAVALLSTGVSTAVPLAWIERSRPAPESWLITAFAPDLIDLDHITLSLLPQLEPRHTHAAKCAVIESVAQLFRGLARGGWHHRDMKASNILLRHWKTGGIAPEAWIVDLDGLSRSSAVRPRTETQRLVRLGASLRSYASITRTDYVRFLKAYRRHAEPHGDWRQEFRSLARAAQQYATRSTHRKSHKIDGYTGD